MNIEIKNPCAENWSEMTAVEQGRHCQVCQKDVVDFTTKSLSEISAFLQQQTSSTCGRFEKYQVQNFNAVYQELPTASNIRKWSLAAIMAGVLAAPMLANQQTNSVTIQEPLITEMLSSYIVETVTNLKVPVGDSIVIEGYVIGIQPSFLMQPNISIEHLNINIPTDKNGYFKFKIPRSDQEVILTASYRILNTEIEQQSIAFIANQNQLELVLDFSPMPEIEEHHMLMGIMVSPD